MLVYIDNYTISVAFKKKKGRNSKTSSGHFMILPMGIIMLMTVEFLYRRLMNDT